MSIFKYLIIIFCTLFTGICVAENVSASDKDEISIWQEQSIHAMNSLLAAYDPEGYGMLVTVLSPVAFMEQYPGYREHTDVTFFSGLLSVGLYNSLELRKDTYSKSDVFLRNMVLWNIVIGGLELLKIDSESTPSGLSLNPIPEGFRVGYDTKF